MKVVISRGIEDAGGDPLKDYAKRSRQCPVCKRKLTTRETVDRPNVRTTWIVPQKKRTKRAASDREATSEPKNAHGNQ